MIRKKKLKEQEQFFYNIKKHEPEKTIKKISKEDLALLLSDCLVNGDEDSFKDVLNAYLDLQNKTMLAKKMKISRTTLYNMFSEEGNPTLENIMTLFKKAA